MDEKKVVRLDAVKIGRILWRVSRVAHLLGHSYMSGVGTYDKGTDQENRFVYDMLAYHSKTDDILDKWKHAVLVAPDGSMEALCDEVKAEVEEMLRREEKK